MAGLAGIAGPIAVSNFISAYGGTMGWRASFELTFATSVFACFFWVLFQKSDIDPILNAPADGWGSIKDLKPVIDERDEGREAVINPIQNFISSK